MNTMTTYLLGFDLQPAAVGILQQEAEKARVGVLAAAGNINIATRRRRTPPMPMHHRIFRDFHLDVRMLIL